MKQTIRNDLFLDRVEPVLAHARVAAAPGAVQAARIFVRQFVEPEYELYSPLTFLKTVCKRFPEVEWHFDVSNTEERVGDADMLSTLLDAILRGFILEEESTLEARVVEIAERQDRIVALRIALQGPGQLGEPVELRAYFRLPLDELSGCWSAASSGGKIVQEDGAIILRFSGMKLPPEPKPEAAALLRLLKTESPTGADAALQYIDGNPLPAPLDLSSVLGGVLEEYGAVLKHAGVEVKLGIARNLPAIVARRPRLRALFAQTLRWVTWCVGESGAIVRIDAAAGEARALNIAIAIVSPEGCLRETFHAAGIARAAADIGAEIETLVEPGEAVVSLLIPDAIARVLDAWIPGWETFAPHSQAMLRMLKSGGSPLGEDFVLGGVLEEELERRLMPRLALPVAAHIAREFHGDNKDLAGSHADRLKKAINQIARDGVKKEICKPAYAGEILWAFRHDERQRFAAGIEALQADDIRALCEALLAQPPRHAEALARVAKMSAP